MKRVLLLLLIPLILFLMLFYNVPKSSSDELDDITKQIQDLTNSLNQSVKATQPLESQLTSMQKQITSIKSKLSFIEKDIVVKEKNINQGYKDLEKQQEILNQAIRNFYIKSYYNSPFLIFFSSSSIASMAQITTYQKAATDQDKAIITNIALAIEDLQNKKKILENEKIQLTSAKADLDTQSDKLDKIVTGAKSYQANLSSKLAQLTAQQQQIIAQKLGSLNIPLTAYTTQGGCSSDLTNGKSAGFSGGFGFFTYGVPNRVGLNQYGAKARAEAGQNAQQILSSYYSADYTTGYNTGINIHVTGSNEYGQSFDDNWNIEEYLKHVYEVPSNWPSESLKAQAIAARSYALSRTNNGASSICPSQSCQVVKREENADSWKQAVSDTAGIVLTSGGNPITAWFSSTHGGYVHSSGDIGWSGTSYTKNAQDSSSSINSFSDLKSNAYDKDSPWFYCDWGARSSYGGTAWLKPEEIADIANVILLVRKNSSNACFVYQTDKAPPPPDPNKGCSTTDNWSSDKVKQELGSEAINSANSVSVNADFGSGKTTTVTINGQNFTGDEFKNYFNVRAPANIQIVGPLYNIERN